jgi:hypothetical protein
VKKISKKLKEPGSFRDPSGFVYYQNKQVFRQIHDSYVKIFRKLDQSDFLPTLVKQHLLLPYKKVSSNYAYNQQANLVLQVEPIKFISYPYEWSFTQLKDAALLTLRLQKIALKHDCSLKDASAYNIQFHQGKPILIDLLSFEKYSPGKPWLAYQQFCEHFLGVLLLMRYTDLRLNQLQRIYHEGVPLDLVSRLLPKKTYFNFAILMHLHFHARNQQRHSADRQSRQQAFMSKRNLVALLENLESLIKSLTLTNKATEWGQYYTFTNYSTQAFKAKKKIVKAFIKLVKPKIVWDLGGNTGEFGRLSSKQRIFTVSFDIDPIAVDQNYRQSKIKGEKYILPLLMDLTNPSSSLGWALKERQSLSSRGPTDLILALALIHHLCISHNLPFSNVASFLKTLGSNLIIEFVPKTDSQVKKLLATREDIFTDYNQKSFEKTFSNHFQIIKKIPLRHGSQRVLYLMKTK